MPDGIDIKKVTGWLEAEIDGLKAPFEFSLIAGGRSNLTFRVTDAGGRQVVLRRPPLGAVLATAHDMAREHRIIAALGPTKVPVPPALGLCEDEDVNGAPFYVMDFVPGVVLGEVGSGEDAFDEASGRRATEHLVEVLADLHSVDPDTVGLGDLGKKEAYLDRQLKRWQGQWEKAKQRELPAMEEAHELLVQAKPEQLYTGIVHGDYRLGNVLLAPEGRLAAVLDWELCTLGDPLADLGYLGVYWADPDGNGQRSNDPTGAGGFPSYQQLVERYAARTGRDVSNIPYYVAFSAFRLAVISEGVYARYLHGAMGDDVDEEILNGFRDAVEELAVGALTALRSGI